jgi:hypothetical protein
MLTPDGTCITTVSVGTLTRRGLSRPLPVGEGVGEGVSKEQACTSMEDRLVRQCFRRAFLMEGGVNDGYTGQRLTGGVD